MYENVLNVAVLELSIFVQARMLKTSLQRQKRVKNFQVLRNVAGAQVFEQIKQVDTTK